MQNNERTIEEIVQEANDSGLFLNNLFQLHSHPANPIEPKKFLGAWQANFHDGNTGYEFGHGATPCLALERALACFRDDKTHRKTGSVRDGISKPIEFDGIKKETIVDPFS
jgi:hypothetical protein